MIAVGGTSATNVYAATATTLYQVSGSTFTPLSGVPQAGCTAFSGIASAGAHVVISATCGSAGQWQNAGASWSALPAPPAFTPGVQPPAMLVQPNGSISYGNHGLPYTLTGGAWAQIPVETPAPVSNVVAVASTPTVYAVGSSVVTLGGGGWSAVPAAPAALASNGATAAEASDGTLFVVLQSASPQVWRYDGSAWHDDLNLTLSSGQFGGGIDVLSSSDALFTTASSIHRWNGSTWATVPPPTFPAGDVLSDAAYVGPTHLLSAYSAGSGTTLNLVEYDGTSWTTLGTATGSCCSQIGVPTAPAGVVTLGTGGYQILGTSGWTSWMPPSPPSGVVVLQVNAGQAIGYVASAPYGYATTTGAAWTVTNTWTLRGSNAEGGIGVIPDLRVDGSTLIGATALAGHLVSFATVRGGDAVTMCTLP